MRYGSLFSGYGGLDMAIEDVFGAKAAWHSEIEPAACRVLERRWPGVPNLGDVAGVDWAEVEPVEIMCGGFPCTDLSAAGKLAGLKPGTRSGLWSEFARAIKALRPELVVIENVRGLTNAPATHPAHDLGFCPGCLGIEPERVVLRALGAVLGDLADLGFDAEWLGLPASDIGAPHPRFRIVVLAWPTSVAPGIEHYWAGYPARSRRAESPDRGSPTADTEGHRYQGQRPGRHSAQRAGAPESGPSVADTEGDGRDEGWAEPAGVGGGSDAALASEFAAAHAKSEQGSSLNGEREQTPADPQGAERRASESDDLGPAGHRTTEPGERAGTDWGEYEPAIRRWESILGRVAPAPVGVGARGGPKLSARFVEWMMGLPDGWVTGEDIATITNMSVSTNEALKMLGNGVVPQQLAAGIRLLLDRVEGE